jgi:hypothetical protein
MCGKAHTGIVPAIYMQLVIFFAKNFEIPKDQKKGYAKLKKPQF